MRTCVAPWATAASRSALIPAEMTLAVGYLSADAAGDHLKSGECRVGRPVERSDRHHATESQCTVRGDSRGHLVEVVVGVGGTPHGAAPGHAAVDAHLDEHVQRPAPVAVAARPSASASGTLSTECTTSA